jgi:hypothetical protein
LRQSTRSTYKAGGVAQELQEAPVMNYRLRKRLFVDSKVQGALLVRSAVYWLGCIAVMSVMLICWEVFASTGSIREVQFDQIWYRYAPALAMSLLILPFVLFDVVRISNRMVGPVYRMRNYMRQLAEGQRVAPLQFRQDDFWKEMADEFNALANIVQRARQTGCGQATVVMDQEEISHLGHESKVR